MTQTATGVSLPRGVAGDVRPQVSCPSVSGCVATFGTANLLVLGQRRGKWAREATLAGVGVRSLACPSIGSCVGTGWIISGGSNAVITQSGRSWRTSAVQFKPGIFESHALLVDHKDGTWGAGFDAQLPPDVVTTPGPEASPVPGGVASVVSCPSAGNSAAAGTYTDTVSGSYGPVYRSEGWVAIEQAGQWRPAVSVQLPRDADTKGEGVATSGTSPFLGFTGISCPLRR